MTDKKNGWDNVGPTAVDPASLLAILRQVERSRRILRRRALHLDDDPNDAA